MIIPRVMPCLLVLDGRLVKTVKFQNPSYVGDPVNAIKIFNDKEVDELILLDISATVANRPPNFALIEEVSNECFMPLCYGGGVRDAEEVRQLFGRGVEKVAINSGWFSRPEVISESARLFGSQSVVASIDVKKDWLGRYRVYVQGGRVPTGREPVETARHLESLGAGEILLTAIDRDGTWSGYDVELIRMVAGAVSIPVIACGGAGTVEDLGRAVREGGASACAAGSMVVYQARGLGVLIRFPRRDELVRVLAERPSPPKSS
jgi:cyclase